MRATSEKRRAHKRGTIADLSTGYQIPRGAEHASAEGVGVFCDGCGTWIHLREDGVRPRLHAPGGYKVSVKRGAVRCEGTKTGPNLKGRDLDLVTLTPTEAAAQNLVTVRMLAEAYAVTDSTMRSSLTSRRVPVRGLLEAPAGSPGKPAALYDLAAATRVLPRARTGAQRVRLAQGVQHRPEWAR